MSGPYPLSSLRPPGPFPTGVQLVILDIFSFDTSFSLRSFTLDSSFNPLVVTAWMLCSAGFWRLTQANWEKDAMIKLMPVKERVMMTQPNAGTCTRAHTHTPLHTCLLQRENPEGRNWIRDPQLRMWSIPGRALFKDSLTFLAQREP